MSKQEVWLLYGGNGWIGGMFQNYIPENVNLVVGKARCSNKEALEEELWSVQPDVVICMVGRTSGPGCNNIDWLEQPGHLKNNLEDNLYSPILLHQFSQGMGFHFVYLGTGCIFSNDDAPENFKTYSTTDKPDFFGSSYSTVKGFTDRYMHDCAPEALNIRIRMPIVPERHPKNLLSKLVSYPKICSTLNSMSVLPDLFPLLVRDIQQRKKGTVHLTNPGAITHHEIMQMYTEIVDPGHRYSLMTEEEQNSILLSKRSHNVLASSYPEAPPLREGIRKIFVSWSEERQKEIKERLLKRKHWQQEVFNDQGPCIYHTPDDSPRKNPEAFDLQRYDWVHYYEHCGEGPKHSYSQRRWKLVGKQGDVYIYLKRKIKEGMLASETVVYYTTDIEKIKEKIPERMLKDIVWS